MESAITNQPVLTKRCNFTDCKKKLVLSDMECRCGKRFCAAHKFSESHKCTFNYREASDQVLTKQLVKCVSERIDKI